MSEESEVDDFPHPRAQLQKPLEHCGNQSLHICAMRREKMVSDNSCYKVTPMGRNNTIEKIFAGWIY